MWGSNYLGQVKSNIDLPTTRHHCDIFSKVAVWPGRNNAQISPANTLHLRYNNEYNEKFDVVVICTVLYLFSSTIRDISIGFEIKKKP